MSAPTRASSSVARARLQLARATRRCAALAAGVTALVLMTPMLLQGPLFGLDLTLTDLGTFCAVRQGLADGSGLWLSPWIGNGGVLAMQPSAQVFYPVRWLFLALPVDWGNALHQVAHLAGGAAATAWLARSFRVRPGLAMAAGIAFALSGPALDLVRHAHYAVAATWLPLAWAAGRHSMLTTDARGRGLPWLALALTALLLGGEPHAFAIAVALLLVEGGLHLRRRGPGCWRALLGLAAAVLLALASAAILLLPLWAELALARRGHALPLDRLLQWSFDVSLWPAALLPGEVFRDGVWSLVRDDQVEPLWNPSPYLGGLFVLLAVLGLRLRRARSAVVVVVVGLVAALGDATPLWPWLLQVVPGMDWFRFPAKYLVVTSLAASVCAALALQHLWHQARARRLLALLSTILLGALLAVIAVLQVAAGSVEDLAAWARELAPAATATFGVDLQLSAARAALPLLAGVLLWRRPTRRTIQLVALCWVLDLGSAAAVALRAGPTLSDLHSPLSGLPGAVLCHGSGLHAASLEVPGAVPGWGKAALHRLVGLPELQACDRMVAAVPYSPLASRVAHQLYYLPPTIAGATARALGCSHVVAAAAMQDADLRQVPWGSLGARVDEPGPVLYQVRDPVPEVTLVHAARLLDEERLLAELPATTSAAAALSLLDDPLARWPALGLPLDTADTVEVATLRWSAPTRATIQLSGRGPAIVALRRSFLAGWSATIRGKPVPVLRAAGAHLAMLVDEAQGAVVELRYRPPRLVPALSLSLAGWLGLIGLWWRTCRRQRRGPGGLRGPRI